MLKTQCLRGDFLENVGQKPFAVFNDPLLMARRTKMAAFARKRQKIFVAAIVASNPGEAASQVAAVQPAVDYVRYIRSPESVTGSVQVVSDAFQFLEMVFHAIVDNVLQQRLQRDATQCNMTGLFQQHIAFLKEFRSVLTGAFHQENTP